MTDACKGTILIVEDERELRFILAAQIRVAGYESLEASDGAVAIQIAAQHQPDVIIMDVGLPVMDGVTATRALKEDVRTAHIPVIMLTARSGTKDVVSGLEAGAQEYLPKPFDVAELVARVHAVHRQALSRRDMDRRNIRLEAEVDVKTRKLQHLYEFMRDLNRAESRDEILDLLVACVETTTGARRISLFLVDATGQYLVCERAVGVDPNSLGRMPVDRVDGITGQVLRSGKMLAAKTYDTAASAGDDYDRDAFLSAPLVSTSLTTRDGVVGVLNVTDKKVDGPFTDDEIGYIRSVADATAIALAGVLQRTRLRQSVRVLLQTLGHLAEFRDEETTLHLERVSKMAKILAGLLQREGPYRNLVSDEFIDMLVQAAPMHDIGKVGIPDEILTKPGALTCDEYEIMKTHTEIGQRVLSQAVDPACPVPLLEMCIEIAHCHHERYDGTGYPRGLAKQDIPLAARIIALVDAYDAITSQRRYKPARRHEEAIEIIRGEAGNHFDPVLVEAFLRCHHRFDDVRQRLEDQVACASTS